MEKGRQEDETTPRPDEAGEAEVIHVYPVEGGGILLTTTEIPQDEPDVPIVESQEPQTEKQRTTSKAPPSVLHCLLILVLFLCLDSADTFFLLFTPPVTVTITPQVKTLSTTATVSLGGAGADIHGRGLLALTVSQSLTTQATGKGHQDATQAAGSLTFYNGSFSSKSIDAGTVFTGSDGIQVVTDQTALIPPGNPPTYGAATVPAHAVHAGSQGNIAKQSWTTLQRYPNLLVCCLKMPAHSPPHNKTVVLCYLPRKSHIMYTATSS